jgi:hypothetical protein
VTTEPEAHAFLTDLTRLAQALDDAVLDSGLPAASGENAGIARSLPKSKSPCSDSLGDMRRDALAYVQQWVGNLSSDLTIRQPDTEHTGPTLTPWVHWLHRHRVDLIARPWWPDAEDELRERVHRPLADQFTPPEPQQIAALGAIARDRKGPASEIARLLSSLTGKRVDRRKVSYLAKSGRINEYIGPDDTPHFSLREAREALEEWQDGREKNAL